MLDHLTDAQEIRREQLQAMADLLEWTTITQDEETWPQDGDHVLIHFLDNDLPEVHEWDSGFVRDHPRLWLGGTWRELITELDWSNE